MARSFVLGNGTILVDLDNQGHVRDFYFPYVGQENHVNGYIHRIGFWIDGTFSWFSDAAWHRTLSYQKETLVTNIEARNDVLELEVQFNDIVMHNKNVFIRRLRIMNRSRAQREVRIFFNQKFEIFESNIGDTVFYNPYTKSMVHYKGKRYFLINGLYCVDDACHSFSQYATGLSGEYGLAGTFVDAEDGQLSGHPIEHGAIDSTVAFHVPVKGQSSQTVYYWVCAGKDLGDVSQLNGFVQKAGPESLIQETKKYWITWSNRTPFELFGLSDTVIDLFKRSLLVIRCHVDRHGSIIASSDSAMLYRRRDTYSYMWPRDGALIVRSLDRAGYPEITEHFFTFCLRALTPFGYLFHKYRPDGSWGSSWHAWIEQGKPQLPIQEDEVGLTLDALWKHYLQRGDAKRIEKSFKPFIEKITDFLLHYIDTETGLPSPSYDLWEEKLGIHTLTCCTVYAGLQAAANFAGLWGDKKRVAECAERLPIIKDGIINKLYDKEKGYFIKRLYYDGTELKKDFTLDMSSFYGPFQFKVLAPDDERVVSTLKHVKDRLRVKTKIGGYARYEDDYYYRIPFNGPGNPWFITTLWLAEYHIAMAKNFEELQPAIDIFDWVASHAFPTGVLSEQMNPLSGEPLSVAPLTWSHAGLVIAVIKYLEKLDALGICKMCSPFGAKKRTAPGVFDEGS